MKDDMNTQKALFGAGCFWGVQYYFDYVPGVIETTVGYSGGHTAYPRYEDVCTGTTGHAEVVQIVFDSAQVSYQTLLQHFFRLHDPTQLNRQGPDVGEQYRSVVFAYDEAQKDIAQSVIDSMQPHYDGAMITEVALAGDFYPAEAYHQKFTQRTGRGQCHVDYEPIDPQQENV